jgi:ABC-2 type transport system permease protein
MSATAPSIEQARTRPGQRALAVARADLRQLLAGKEFWLAAGIMSTMFFVVVPAAVLAMVVHSSDASAVDQVSRLLGALPDKIQHGVQGSTAAGRAGYAFSVYLFAPVAVIVPLTVAAGVGAYTIVGERERGTGEFLAHSPATEREIYLGKLIASLIPGWFTLFAGFLSYAVVVNLIAGPELGGWFFPTGRWWLLILWVMPPCLAVALSMIVRVSGVVKSAAAAQQASSLVTLPVIVVAYGAASGSLFSSTASVWILGAVAWAVAAAGLVRGTKAVQRERLVG